MSEEIFPNKKKKDKGSSKDKKEDSSSIKEALLEKIEDITSYIPERRSKSKNDSSSINTFSPSKSDGNGNSFNGELSEIRENLDRFTVLVVGVEIFLVVYLALSLLGILPFF